MSVKNEEPFIKDVENLEGGGVMVKIMFDLRKIYVLNLKPKKILI